ncbi:MAG: type 4a pilus biogenesis protein PilO [Coriobacteriia bacterium]
MKIGPREQLILVIVGLFVVLAAIAALLVWPQYQKQRLLDGQIASAEQRLSASRALLSQRQEIKNRTSATSAQWLELASLVPENPDLPSLIIDLQDAAFASGVQIFDITPAEPTVAADYVTIPLDISIRGTWADTVDFTKSVVKLNRGLREESFSAKLAGVDAGDPTLPHYSVETVIKLQAYTIPASSGATTAPPAAPAPATP